jgi:hypothetical protein
MYVSPYAWGGLLIVVHCSMLAEDAIRDYQSKRTKRATLGPDAITLGPETPVAQGAT